MFFKRSKIKEDPINVGIIRSDVEGDQVFQRLLNEIEHDKDNKPVLEKKIINLRQKLNATIFHLYKATRISDHWTQFLEEQGMKDPDGVVIFGKGYANFRISSEYEKNPDNLDLRNLVNLMSEHNNCVKEYNELMRRISSDTKVARSSEVKEECTVRTHCHTDALMIARQMYPSSFGYI